MNLTELRGEYSERKNEIKQRLSEFRKRKSKEDLFLELCYCLCTPLSKAERVYAVINRKNKRKLMVGSASSLASFLRGNCRFHKNKSKYIAEARGKLGLLSRLPENPQDAREVMVRNFKGLGYKEASHFLRNIGYRNLAILDGHILGMLHHFGALSSKERPTSRKRYMEMEEKMKGFAKKINIDLDELDLLFWSLRTGKVLK